MATNLSLLTEVLYDLAVAPESGMLERSGTIFVVARVGTNLGLPTEVLYDLGVAPESGMLDRVVPSL